jgi:hypothetical protein
MMKINYNEPEFKVVKAMGEDVIATSLDIVDKTWDQGQTSNANNVDVNDLFSL